MDSVKELWVWQMCLQAGGELLDEEVEPKLGEGFVLAQLLV